MTNEELEDLEARAELASEVTLPGVRYRELLAEIRRLREALENAIGRLDGCAFAQKVGGHTTKDLKAALAGKEKHEP